MIASLIARVARGKHGAQDLSLDEARTVWRSLLADDADPMQLGAFLIAERMKGETAEELAGFVLAAQDYVSGYHQQSQRNGWVDLPCYAGKRRAVPAHLLAAVQLARQGVPMVVHGVEHIAERSSAWQCLQAVGVQRAYSVAEAAEVVESQRIVYCDLADLCPPMMYIYGLRQRLGVRTFANSVARLLNPLHCAGQLNGVFHTPYVERMVTANQHLGQARSMVFMGAEGEPELYADRQKRLLLQQSDDVSASSLADLGCAPYAKDAMTADVIQAQFIALHNGDGSSDERARITRSMQALRWAAVGGEWE
ncbi:MAG: anthranilate phosphoribosyltransferase [Mariprofundaceae bacterium]|nr:anthranilate phosphoribosyltransferase [Mariprofundaceae bacterium]